jgi:hypothetical protein
MKIHFTEATNRDTYGYMVKFWPNPFRERGPFLAIRSAA